MKVTPTPHPLLPPEMQAEYRRLGYWLDLTLAEVVADGAARHPDRFAIVGEQVFTYAQLWLRARRLAGALIAAGIQPGEFLVVVQSNSWQSVTLAVAASVAGIALSPLSVRASPTLAVNVFDQLSARGFLLQADLLQSPEWQQAYASLKGRLAGRPAMLHGALPGTLAAYRAEATLEAACESGPIVAQRARDPGRPSLVLSTGGSTGVPKSVVHCDNTLLYAARSFGAGTDMTESDVHVAFGPSGHASGSLFEIHMPLMFGAAILPNARFKALEVGEAIARYRGTYCITVGTHVYDLLALQPGTEPLFRSMRVVVSGAGPDQLFVDAEKRFGFKVVRDYGLSECLGHAPGRPGDPPELRLHKDGVPFPGIERRFVDAETGQVAALGRPGEYFVRGPSLFMGYYGQPELTCAALTEDGFYKTGDLMIASEDGYQTYAGRMKDLIRRGGLQIDLIEMENLLMEHASIGAVVVVGEPHPRLGETAAVVVVPKDRAALPTLDELLAHLLARGLPKESLPERLVFAGELPTTEWGKFNRVELKKWLAAQPR
jgi:acyl-CoA synthetase (AMP-forming)/AMP-acid ligase II